MSALPATIPSTASTTKIKPAPRQYETAPLTLLAPLSPQMPNNTCTALCTRFTGNSPSRRLICMPNPVVRNPRPPTNANAMPEIRAMRWMGVDGRFLTLGIMRPVGASRSRACVQSNRRELTVHERQNGPIGALVVSTPPLLRRPAGGRIGEVIIVDDGANEPWRPVAVGVFPEQRHDRTLALEKPQAEEGVPPRNVILVEGGEPHLPVEPWHVRCHEWRRSPEVACLPSKLVGCPRGAVVAAFH